MTHTRGAVRLARFIRDRISQEQHNMHGPQLPVSDKSVDELAGMIDQYTKAPKMLAALKGVLPNDDLLLRPAEDGEGEFLQCRWCERCDSIDERADLICRFDDCPGHIARAIIADVEGGGK